MASKDKRKYADKYPFVIDCYERGISTYDIAKITGIPTTTVLRMLHDKGVELRKAGIPRGTKKRKNI